ncbi:MAG: hypothetical protein CME95_13245 [Hyphomonadaceae bacterium]|nr:hypothetical protein [Hyphomonadaceae bacterium]
MCHHAKFVLLRLLMNAAYRARINASTLASCLVHEQPKIIPCNKLKQSAAGAKAVISKSTIPAKGLDSDPIRIRRSTFANPQLQILTLFPQSCR